MMEENIYALSDKEVFQRVVPASIKKVCASVALVGITFLTAHFFRNFAFDLSWLFLVCFAIDILIVATLLESALIILQFKSDIARRTKYDIGASLVRVAEGGIIFVCGYTLYTHFIK